MQKAEGRAPLVLVATHSGTWAAGVGEERGDTSRSVPEGERTKFRKSGKFKPVSAYRR